MFMVLILSNLSICFGKELKRLADYIHREVLEDRRVLTQAVRPTMCRMSVIDLF